jgi:hypothetical protein
LSELNPSDDIVIGATAIGAVFGLRPTQAFYLLKRGKLPAKKLGVKWISSKRALLAAVVPQIEGECA